MDKLSLVIAKVPVAVPGVEKPMPDTAPEVCWKPLIREDMPGVTCARKEAPAFVELIT